MVATFSLDDALRAINLARLFGRGQESITKSWTNRPSDGSSLNKSTNPSVFSGHEDLLSSAVREAGLEPVEATEDSQAAQSQGRPRVYLVGTGPGDPGLLTMRAVELMRKADVVLYDRLVSPEILEYVSDDATMVYVGKEKGYHTRTQDEIHALLCEFAFERGPKAIVLRLKGGDPFVFGRGGEEAEYLHAHGIDTCIVPGITAAAGIGAELGIPLTHRGVAHSVRFLTGHMRDGIDVEAGDMPDGTTLVVYMGLSYLRPLLDTLASRGLTPDTPAVAVERGTTSDQRVVWGTASSLPDLVDSAALVSPTLVIIGEVVGLAPGFSNACKTGVPIVVGRAVEVSENVLEPDLGAGTKTVSE